MCAINVERECREGGGFELYGWKGNSFLSSDIYTKKHAANLKKRTMTENGTQGELTS